MQKLHQTSSYAGIVAMAIISSLIGAPDRCQRQRLGPKAQCFIIIVSQNDPAPGAHRSNHVLYRDHRIAEVLEQKARMCNIKCAPLGSLNRGCFNLSLPHLKEMGFLL